MLSLLIKFAKKALLVLIMSTLLITGGFNHTSYADYSENEYRKVDVVIRAGEWQNETTAKPGKRYTWGTDISLSEHGLTVKDVPLDIPLRKCDDGFYISEADINLKTAKAIAKKLSQKGDVDVDLQYSNNSSTDLNAAGRIAVSKNPTIYFSVHHNSWKEDSRGYFFISNEDDYKSTNIAQSLSDSIKDNNLVPQMKNRTNVDNYIGELNETAKNGRISILGELGFFSNPEELKLIMSDEYVDYISSRLADKLYETLKEQINTTNITKDEKQQKVIGIKKKEKTEKVILDTNDGLKIKLVY